MRNETQVQAAEQFGRWLRHYRQEYGYTQKELGERVNCSAALIRKIEAGERRPSRQVAELILAALEIPAAARPALLKQALNLPGEPAPPTGERAAGPDQAAAAPVGGAVPGLPVPLTSLIGREAAEAKLDLLLRRGARLVTLVGPPGIGKTRLAIAAADAATPAFRDGVAFAGLAPVRDPALVPGAIAAALRLAETPGQPAQANLIGFLQGRQMLLVLDNFEQIMEAAPVVLDLLAACPALAVLITSREALHVRGEQLFPVPALAVPGRAGDGSPDALRAWPAVALFVDRARAADPTFALTAENAAAVAAICRQLAGLPLALELAAARIRHLAPEAIAGRLDHSLSLLTGGPRDLPSRQQTLRAAIAWSYDLLEPGEQTLFRRLGVFAGGATLSVVEAVANATGDLPFVVLDGLAGLVDKSLLQPVPGGGEPRFAMLEMIREFAAAALAASGEGPRIERLFAEYFVGLAQAAEEQMTGAAQAVWFDRLEAEHDNLRAVLRWALREGAMDVALPLVAAVWRFWEVRSHWNEGLDWVEAALAHPGAAAPSVARARALIAAARLTHWVRGAPRGRARAEEALAISRASGYTRGVLTALMLLGHAALEDETHSAAGRFYAAALATARESGDERGEAVALANLAYVAMFDGNLAQAEQYAEASRDLFARYGDDFSLSVAEARLAELALATGRLDVARDRFGQVLRVLEALEHAPGTITVLTNLGRVLSAAGRPAEAAAYLRRALHLVRDSQQTRMLTAVLAEVANLLLAGGDTPTAGLLLEYAAAHPRAQSEFEGPITTRLIEAQRARARGQLGPALPSGAAAPGQAPSGEDAITLALDALASHYPT